MKARLPKVGLAILPAGSTEQHGPHLTFETDIAIATELARRLALQHFPRILVAPPLPAGLSNAMGEQLTAEFLKRAGGFVEAFMRKPARQSSGRLKRSP